MRDQKKAVGSCPKPMPQVVSFQDPLPQPRRYRPQADRILSGDPVQTATNGPRSLAGSRLTA
jgi:hypothetical protein